MLPLSCGCARLSQPLNCLDFAILLFHYLVLCVEGTNRCYKARIT
jgi:hypothetical protein